MQKSKLHSTTNRKHFGLVNDKNTFIVGNAASFVIINTMYVLNTMEIMMIFCIV